MTAPATVAGSPIRSILSRLKSPKRSGTGFVAMCPAHEDANPSLSITEGKDGRVLLNCHAGCTPNAIVSALGLEMMALFAPRPQLSVEKPDKLTLLTTYDYTDPSGKLLFQVCRFIKAGGEKTFRQRRPDGKGGWVYGLDKVTPVLYRLPEVQAAVESGRTVHVVEGEKDADALAGLGYIATTSPMGAGKWRDIYSESLRGAEVVIFPDNDDPGREHAQQVAASLASRKCTVKVVPLPGVPAKGDFSDWLEQGGNLDELEELIGQTRLWTADSESTKNRYRLDELWSNGELMKPPPVVVPRIAWSGRLTLLAAREKAGKSTLTGFLTAQVSRGGLFLGFSCAMGTVLVIGLEEFIGDAARRLRDFEADATRVHIVDRLHGDPQSRPQEVRSHIEAVDPTLVIIDSLSAYSSGQIQDENNAAQMTAVIKPLADLAHDSGRAIVVLHHASKSTGKARGSTGIMANADVVCEFYADEKKQDTDPTLRTMRTAGRVPTIPRWDFRFDGDTYTLADGVEAPIEHRIVAVITECPTISINDVCNRVGGRRTEVQSAIQRMISSGLVVNSGNANHGKLIIPSPRAI